MVERNDEQHAAADECALDDACQKDEQPIKYAGAEIGVAFAGCKNRACLVQIVVDNHDYDENAEDKLERVFRQSVVNFEPYQRTDEHDCAERKEALERYIAAINHGAHEAVGDGNGGKHQHEILHVKEKT